MHAKGAWVTFAALGRFQHSACMLRDAFVRVTHAREHARSVMPTNCNIYLYIDVGALVPYGTPLHILAPSRTAACISTRSAHVLHAIRSPFPKAGGHLISPDPSAHMHTLTQTRAYENPLANVS